MVFPRKAGGPSTLTPTGLQDRELVERLLIGRVVIQASESKRPLTLTLTGLYELPTGED